MSFLKKIIISLAILFGIFSIVSLSLPSEWKVSRSIEIDASPSEIFPFLNDLHKWSQWYPWSRSGDVSVNVTYDGPETGVGSIRSWSGSSTKNGRIEITKSIPDKGIWYSFSSSETKMIVYGSLQIFREKNGSRVVWEDTGNTGKNIFARFFASSLDSIIGDKFEAGLSNLKNAAEK